MPLVGVRFGVIVSLGSEKVFPSNIFMSQTMEWWKHRLNEDNVFFFFVISL